MIAMSRWPALVMLASLASVGVAHADDAATAEERRAKGKALYELGKYREAIVEWEASYELDRKPNTLYAIAQAYRFLEEYDRAIQLFRHFLDVAPEDPDREKILAEIETLKVKRDAKLAAAKAAADKAAADKAAADKAASDKAAADKAAAELAAEQARQRGDNKRIRIAVDVGLSVIRIEGLDKENRSPQLGGRLAGSWIKRVGAWTFDLGGSWQLTTIPFTEMPLDGPERQASVFFTQLHATGSVMRSIGGPFWIRFGLGLGVSAFGNLKRNNPVVAGAPDNGSSDLRMPCARIDTLLGYRYSATLDFVLSVAGTSVSGSNASLDPAIDRVHTFEGGWLGVYIKI